MINASYGGQTYSDVNTLVASDGTTNATVALSESGVIPTPAGTKEITQNGTGIDVMNYASVNVNVSGGGGGSVGGLSEYSTQTLTLTEEPISAGSGYQCVRITHNLTATPKIVKIKLNYSGTVSDHKGFVFGCIFGGETIESEFGCVQYTNTNTGAFNLFGYEKKPTVATVAQYQIDATEIKITRPTNSVAFDGTNTYTIECWA